MTLETSPPNENCGRDEQFTDHIEYRVRYHFGELELYSEWSSELATVENFAEQLRREHAAHDIAVEKREGVRL